MLNFKKRKIASLLAFISMIGVKSSISKALEVTKNPLVTKTLAAEKTAVLNGEKKVFTDWVKNHKILTGGIGTLFLGGLVTASVFLAKHIKNKNKIENNDDKPDNSNSELNALNNEDNGEKNNEKNDNEFSESENDTNISNNNEENNENNLNNEKNENIQIENENIINSKQKIDDKANDNKNIIIDNKEQNRKNENLNIENIKEKNKNKNIINLDINNKEKKIVLVKNIKPKFNNEFKFDQPKGMNKDLYKVLQNCLNNLPKNNNITKLKDVKDVKDVIDCFNNELELTKIELDRRWNNNPSPGEPFYFNITIKKNNKSKKYIIDFKYSKKDNRQGYVFDDKVDIREVQNSKQLINKQKLITEQKKEKIKKTKIKNKK